MKHGVSGYPQALGRERVRRAQTHVRDRITKRLLVLEGNPRPSGIKKLQGEESYRFRVGDYRVLYTVDDKAKQVFSGSWASP